VAVAVRQARRDVVPVAHGAAARRPLSLLGLPRREVVPVSEGAPAVGCVPVAVAMLPLVLSLRVRRWLGRGRLGRGRLGRRLSGRGRFGGRRLSGRRRRRRVRSIPLVGARRSSGLSSAACRSVRGSADRARRLTAARRRGVRGRGRSRRRLRRSGALMRVGGRRRRRHDDLCGRRRRSGAGTGTNADRGEVWWKKPCARVENQSHRGSAEHKRDQRRRRHTSESPNCTPLAAFVGRQRPVPPLFGRPSPA
jgi:hypothetical protein